jgi:transposase-like protein
MTATGDPGSLPPSRRHVAECPTCPVCASDVFVDAVPIPEDRYECHLCSYRFAPSEVRHE